MVAVGDIIDGKVGAEVAVIGPHRGGKNRFIGHGLRRHHVAPIVGRTDVGRQGRVVGAR